MCACVRARIAAMKLRGLSTSASAEAVRNDAPAIRYILLYLRLVVLIFS